MRQQDQRPDEWPTFLWIAWREGETDRVESLCRAHRAYVFERYPSAHGLRRRGDRCAMCLVHPPQRAQLRNPRDSTTPPGEPRAAEPWGRGNRGRGGGSRPPATTLPLPGSGRTNTRRRRMRTNNGAPRTQAVERVPPIWRVPRAPSRPIHRRRDEAAGDALLQDGEDTRHVARIGICRDSANGST